MNKYQVKAIIDHSGIEIKKLNDVNDFFKKIDETVDDFDYFIWWNYNNEIEDHFIELYKKYRRNNDFIIWRDAYQTVIHVSSNLQ